MRLRHDIITEQRARVLATSSKAFKAKEKELEHVAVCLIGYGGRVPKEFGDNRGAWPVRIATTNKPRDVAKRPDLESPLHQIMVLEMVWTESDAHARRLKAKLDTLLLGTSSDNRALRHGWRDLDNDPAIVWPILLGEALEQIRQRERIEVMGEDERVRRIAAALRGRVR